MAKNNTKNNRSDTEKNTSNTLNKTVGKNMEKSAARTAAKNAGKGTAENKAKSTGKNTAKAGAKSAGGNTVKSTTKSTGNCMTKTGAKNTGGNTVKSTTKNTTKNTGKNAVKNTGKRTKSTTKTTGKETSQNKVQDMEPQGIPMKNEIQLVASFGIMLILLLSNFGYCGKVGVWLSSFFFGIFGCVQYVMPVAFFLMVAVLIANDFSILAMKKSVAGFVTLILIAAFSQILYQGEIEAFYDLFAAAVKDHHAGGMLGGGIGLLLEDLFGTPGAIIILFCALLLALIELTQKSLVEFFRQSVHAVETKSKAISEWHAQAAQERKEKRKENKEKASLADKVRTKQCEDKLKEMEEKKEEKKTDAKQSRLTEEELIDSSKEDKTKKEPDIRIHVPIFTSSDEVKPRDSVKELHPEIYPFTAEDGKPKAFEGKLDFTAFSFNSGKTPEEFEEEMQKQREDAFFAQEEHKKKESKKGLPEEITVSEDYVLEGSTIEEETVPETIKVPEWTVAAEETEPAEPTQEKGEETETEETEDYENTTEETISEEFGENMEEIELHEETMKNMEDSTGRHSKGQREKSSAAQKMQSTSESGRQTSAPDMSQQTSMPEKTRIRKSGEKEDYLFPPLSLLVSEKQQLAPDFDKNLKDTAIKLQSTLESFGVKVTITDISCGPTVTRYEMFPEQGTKVSKIVSLTDDIKLNLAASDIRIEAPIPGKAAIGIEVPNKQNMTVHFRELVDSRVFRNFKSKLAFAVGKDIGGKIVVADLAKMPHLLIAGATGSGKSVCINTLIMSILYKAKPSEVKLIMIDPKMVELSTYNGIPHLLIPVVTDPKKASGALNWAVSEMTDRYKRFTESNVRNIEGYNKKVDDLIASGEVEADKMERMPQIVIIIDELADLMMVAPGEVEDAIVRLSQLARAAGIHLVIATQRPSVNVITGLIKANVPSRIAFSVSSGVDSRTIIDMNGAEKLLGKGDMLFYPSGYQKPVRVQGGFVTDAEIGSVVEFLKENETVAAYDDAVTEKIENKIKNDSLSGERDEYFEAAARFIMEKDKATIGMLQRMFKIGFNRAARIIDQLADAGIVGPEEGTKPRKILMTPEQLDQFFEENF